MRRRIYRLVIRFTLMVLILASLLPAIALADLTVYFLDVGEGDSSIIVCDGKAMIIDGGLPGASSKIYSYIKDVLKLEKLEYMIATHPDEDHIGGLSGVLNAVPVERILTPVKEWNTKQFSKMKEYAQKSGTPLVVPYTEDNYYLGSATFTILWCDTTATDPNEMSICLRIDYGDTSFLFTGDIEGYAEYSLGSLDVPLQASVLKVSHHGSSTSSSYDFLQLVQPEYAVISCGKGNKFRHPNQETLDRLRNLDITLFRTDLQGTIVCTSDGHTISFEPERNDQTDQIFIAPK